MPDYTPGRLRAEGSRVIAINPPDNFAPSSEHPHYVVAQCRTHCLLEPPESEAYARLFAAAPDLLEALRELVRAVDGTLQGYGALEPYVEAGRKAIAKAEGKS